MKHVPIIFCVLAMLTACDQSQPETPEAIEALAAPKPTPSDASATPATDAAEQMPTEDSNQEQEPMTQLDAQTPLRFTMTSLSGRDVDLSTYAGRVVLIVNTASECGLTKQYAGLQKLHEQYADQGLAVLGFPANEFGNQEPGSDEQIAQFCEKNYGVDFDMFSKVVVKGDGQCELYQHLTSEQSSPHPGEISWNFEKFLVGRDGQIKARFSPQTTPESDEVVQAIEAELAKG